MNTRKPFAKADGFFASARLARGHSRICRLVGECVHLLAVGRRDLRPRRRSSFVLASRPGALFNDLPILQVLEDP